MDEGLERAFQRLSPRARVLLERAAGIANQRGHRYLAVEHIVVALLSEQDLVQTLQRVGVNPQVLREIAESELQRNFNLDEPGLPCTPRVYRLLTQRVLQVADRRRSPLVTPEHLMIAVLEEETAFLVQELRSRGVDVQEVLSEIQRPRPVAFRIPPPLNQWCQDLTALAEAEELFPVIDREEELEQVVRILSMPRGLGPANPVLLGEAGVGKTAIVEGLAQRIVQGRVPSLSNVRILQVNVISMLSGTFLRGSFEQKVKATIDFASKPHQEARVILFIDELHLIIGAGRASGQEIDAAQALLEPLGQGKVQIIGATTTDQYEAYIAKDEALKRRFSPVVVREPTTEQTKEILEGIVPALESRFKESGMEIQFSKEALESVIELSSLYLLSERMPAKPKRWLILAGVEAHFRGKPRVEREDVIAVVSKETGIPEDIIFRRQSWTAGNWERVLRARVMGQDEAISEVVHHVLLNLGPLRRDPRKPIGVFLFVGPTGVGKTELAKALAELMLGDEDRILRLDMSEYQGELGLRRLVGPPRGIVGEGRGILTDRIWHQPYTVLLLDEFEKADQVVRAAFLQVFDEGWLTDGLGRKVFFRDTVIILTSNIGARAYMELVNHYQSQLGFIAESLESHFQREAKRLYEEAIRKELSPELANRFTSICVFSPLTQETLIAIVQMWLAEERERFQKVGKYLEWEEGVAEHIATQGFDPQFGARAVKRYFDSFIARELNPRLGEGHRFRLVVAAPSGAAASALQVIVEPEVQTTEAD